MNHAEAWSDTLRELAEGLDDKSINTKLDQWPQIYHRTGDGLVVFTGRKQGKTSLIERLLAVPGGAGEGGPGAAEVFPPGVRWLDATPYQGNDDLDGDLRRCDAVVISIPATSAANKFDVELIRDRIAGGAHVPAITVVITGADDLEPDELDAVTRYVRRSLSGISPRIAVSIEPPPASPDRPGWVGGLLPGPSRAQRTAQALAQLGEIAAEVESAARGRAEQADAESRRDDGPLTEAETQAERLLDVAAVRRELRARQQTALSSVRGKETPADLEAGARRDLRGANGDREKITEALNRFRDRADALLAAAHDGAAGTVETDAGWLNERLGAYAEAWEVAYRRTAAPDLGSAGRLGELHGPTAVKESWVLKKIAIPVGKLADILLSVVVDTRTSGSVDKAGEELRRGQRIARKLGDKGASEAARMVGDVVTDGIHKLAQSREANRWASAAEATVLEAGRSLAAELDRLGLAVGRAYDALAAEFDRARLEWRETQRVRGAQRLTEAGDRWRSVVTEASKVKSRINAELAAEERN